MSAKVSKVQSISPEEHPDSIAIALEDLSSDIRSGKVKVKTLVIVIDNAQDQTVHVRTVGYRPRKSNVIGLLDYAKHRVYEQ